MNEVQISIDGREFTVPEGLPVRKAAVKNGIYVPGICGHPYLPPAAQTRQSQKVFRGAEEITASGNGGVFGDTANCNLCLVKIEGEPELQRACGTKAVQGLIVQTHSEEISQARKNALAKILAHHPHSCLTCAQKEGCSLTQCSSNVPENERCCILLNRCELGKIVDFIGLPENLPKYVPENFPIITGDPFFERDYNLCISCLRCVRVCNDVRGAGSMGAVEKDGRIWVGTAQPGLLQDSFCRFCGACVEVCPTGALRDKPDSKPVHHGESPPCIDACPAGIDIPGYLHYIAKNDYTKALEIIYNKVPFPGILGYVCFHPCEDECKRKDLDEGLAICALKRFAFENGDVNSEKLFIRKDSTGKRAAIIGSGPAGLTAAFYLQKAGHQVSVYEADDKPGGMLNHALPKYRLPESILEEELKPLRDMGVKFLNGYRIGGDICLHDILEEYNAVLLTTGASNSRKLKIPGEELPGVTAALDFLRQAKTEGKYRIRGKVIVIGGGNVAIDAAMTAVRLGAEAVKMVCLEHRDVMPAHEWEIEQAVEEGVIIEPGWGPVEFSGEKGKLTQVGFKRCSSVFDDAGRFNPAYDENETFEEEADLIIVAIGQSVDRDPLLEFDLLDYTPAGFIKTGDETSTTDVPDLYAAGDAVSGPSSVIDAIASGRKAADAIDRMLGGGGIEFIDTTVSDPFLGKNEEFHKHARKNPPAVNPSERVKEFCLIEGTLIAEDAETEADRCLRCHLRAMIIPVHLPPDKWQTLTPDNIAVVPSAEGVYQLAGSDKKVTKIAGTQDLKAMLEEECENQPEDTLFCWEEDKMYSKRENELLQKHLQEYGEMPGGGGDDDLDDLF